MRRESYYRVSHRPGYSAFWPVYLTTQYNAWWITLWRMLVPATERRVSLALPIATPAS